MHNARRNATRRVLLVLLQMLALATATTATCEPGSWGPGGISPCTPCPAGRTSLQAAASATQCFCEPSAVAAQSFASLRDVVSDATMDTWTSHGVQQWVSGELGQACELTCTAHNMTCRHDLNVDVFTLLQASEMQAIVPRVTDGLACANTNRFPGDRGVPCIVGSAFLGQTIQRALP